ncbi:MAG: patatin-like phospholipase family protein [Candidatus Obscuribacterales bacterium]|nr:patatin-like phospholipase family protein [Candidatus Obscuribacterales bacterium]
MKLRLVIVAASALGVFDFSQGLSARAEDPDITKGSVTKSAAEEQKSNVSSSSNRKVRVALVLGGGGTRGAAHVGVLKVLKEEKIPIDLVVGTSMGAIVGGFYCAGLPLERIEKMFVDRSLMRAYMTVPLLVRLITVPIMTMPRLVYHPYDGLYWGIRFRRFLNSKLPDNEKHIQDLIIPYAAVAVDLTDGQPHVITSGRLSYAMQASSAVPGLRKPVQIYDQLFVDGGVLENVPVEQATELGADIIIAVNVDERMERVPLKTFRRMGSVSSRVVTMQLELLDREHLNKACAIIHPDVNGIGLLSTKKRDAVTAIERGEQAAREALPQIRRCLTDAGVEF